MLWYNTEANAECHSFGKENYKLKKGQLCVDILCPIHTFIHLICWSYYLFSVKVKTEKRLFHLLEIELKQKISEAVKKIVKEVLLKASRLFLCF